MMSTRCESIRLLIVDDDDLTRDGLKAGLSAENDFIIQEASDGFKALQYFQDDRPDVVLLDMKMPGMNGIETLRELGKIDSSVPVVIMTAYGDIPSAVEAMKCGAYDFTIKPPKMNLLIAALKKAAQTSRKEPEGPASKRPAERGPAAHTALECYKNLTDREREIFKLTAGGISSTQVAERLSISPRTVEKHRQNLMQKMNVSNKADLVRLAVRLNILR